MNQVCREMTDYVSSCERLLSKQGTLTTDEKDLLEYYIRELSREFLSNQATVSLGHHQAATANNCPLSV